MNKASTPKGTRDFLPLEMTRRNYIFDTIKSIFQLYGYQPIETPAMENMETLTGKYGEEGDRLLYKILNSGDFTVKLKEKGNLDDLFMNPSLVASEICEKGLRYDLTVPFARFVVEHRHELVFPFKRYQMQQVWRADRPQKGRYREFVQCDADVIGSTSLLNEVELMRIIHEVFARFQIPVKLKINNRKILAGMAETFGISDRFYEFTIALDKIEKTGLDKVLAELEEKAFPELAIRTIRSLFEFREQHNEEKLLFMTSIIGRSETGLYGIKELKEIMDYAASLHPPLAFEIDLSLARGLNYYTGCIFEVSAMGTEMGSLCGGGRYDDLTGVFGLPDVSGVGISFGADRIYDVLNEMKLFPQSTEKGTKVMIANFGIEEVRHGLFLLETLQNSGIPAELYPDAVKMKKQFTYADHKHIPFVLLAGNEEIQASKYALKNMATGEQQQLSLEDIISVLK